MVGVGVVGRRGMEIVGRGEEGVLEVVEEV